MNDFGTTDLQPPAGGFGVAPRSLGATAFGYGARGPALTPRSQRLAVIACVLGVLSLPTLVTGIGLAFAIAAMITGHRAKALIVSEPQRYTGRALAVAGFWCGLVTLTLVVLYLVAAAGYVLFVGER